MHVRLYQPSDKEAWDSFVCNHPESTHCHLSGWKEVIERTYHHRGYYLLAEEELRIIGVLPLFHIKSFLFGNHLVSVPFLNYGGVLADSPKISNALIEEAILLGSRLKADSIELRHLDPIGPRSPETLSNFVEQTHKVRMLLKLPESGEELLKSFKSKLRSQIHRPQKEGMTAFVGGAELLNDFYKVFSINMRDLGSPVHSKKLFSQILSHFGRHVKIGIVRDNNHPVAAGLIFSFREIVEIPWASSLRKHNRSSPNMLLYWSLLEYACNRGFDCFDFGRSTPGEGTYKFKEQWGAKSTPLYYVYISLDGKPIDEKTLVQSRFKKAINCWKKLPVFATEILGPMIRKHIEL